ncbi:hypothetical protein GCM10009774_19570 [Cellulomonas gelida]|uniref:Uncharacterized protein n=1 Tax=Cellulomonas gelida TaxID=1712 RepID=A0A4Y3KJU1_9CELL|nr:hypothetical protein CGE01nite_04610 [Cellulomonas gelida]GGL29303.1 hypothetical protein GCM10009774_19570 [Cellulomonas gelida]
MRIGSAPASERRTVGAADAAGAVPAGPGVPAGLGVLVVLVVLSGRSECAAVTPARYLAHVVGPAAAA